MTLYGGDVYTDVVGPRDFRRALRIRATKDGEPFYGLDQIAVCAGDTVVLTHTINAFDEDGRATKLVKRVELKFESV